MGRLGDWGTGGLGEYSHLAPVTAIITAAILGYPYTINL